MTDKKYPPNGRLFSNKKTAEKIEKEIRAAAEKLAG